MLLCNKKFCFVIPAAIVSSLITITLCICIHHLYGGPIPTVNFVKISPLLFLANSLNLCTGVLAIIFVKKEVQNIVFYICVQLALLLSVILSTIVLIYFMGNITKETLKEYFDNQFKWDLESNIKGPVALDLIERSLGCCGVTGFEDYTDHTIRPTFKSCLGDTGGKGQMKSYDEARKECTVVVPPGCCAGDIRLSLRTPDEIQELSSSSCGKKTFDEYRFSVIQQLFIDDVIGAVKGAGSFDEASNILQGAITKAKESYQKYLDDLLAVLNEVAREVMSGDFLYDDHGQIKDGLKGYLKIYAENIWPIYLKQGASIQFPGHNITAVSPNLLAITRPTKAKIEEKISNQGFNFQLEDLNENITTAFPASISSIGCGTLWEIISAAKYSVDDWKIIKTGFKHLYLAVRAFTVIVLVLYLGVTGVVNWYYWRLKCGYDQPQPLRPQVVPGRLGRPRKMRKVDSKASAFPRARNAKLAYSRSILGGSPPNSGTGLQGQAQAQRPAWVGNTQVQSTVGGSPPPQRKRVKLSQNPSNMI